MPSVGKSIPHDSAVGHLTGEAAFLDDLPMLANELFVGFVGSPVASGQLQAIDLSAAKQVDGVIGLFTADDVDGENEFGPVFQDEPFLASGKLLYVGQPVVVVAAETRLALEQAKRAVVISARELEPVLTIERAIERCLYIGPAWRIMRGDVGSALAAAAHVLSGTFRSGGQEQFYLESQAAIAYPGEEGQLVVHSSTQNPTEIQTVVAEVLGLGRHQVVCICKRLGGAFGGKETQAAIPAAMAALVAHKTGRAARVIYSKDDDMRVTGKRHAYRTDWKVGFDDQGTIAALKIDFHSNGGAAADLSMSIMQRSLLHAENAYYIPNIEINGRICFTNLPPNTAFRGFGGPQAIAAVENIIESVSQQLGLDSYDVRLRNVYGAGSRQLTPYGQLVEPNHLPELFRTLAASSQYKPRREDIAKFNARSKIELRGLSMTAVKFGIAFTTRFMNQGNALVNVYADGTVQVSTGGTEMGQGLNTKIRQLVADQFAIQPEHVLVMPTSTEKNHNTSPTAASSSTDLNGAAAVRACEQIKGSLRAFAARVFASQDEGVAASSGHIVFADGHVFDSRRPRERLSFRELSNLARCDRVDLGARGFYATPGIDFNWDTGRGNPFYYFTQGVAAAEVVVDRFTGDLRVTRVDLLIDVGDSINPGVDRGQVTGGFVQGMGWVTCEELKYNERGELLSHSPTTYKIPAITDVPEVFNVAFFESGEDVENIAGSKAVGEPPLMLGIAPWAAVKHALSFVSPGEQTDLCVPATNEEILRCLTALTTSGKTAEETSHVG